jgi:serine/threonine protein kinase
MEQRYACHVSITLPSTALLIDFADAQVDIWSMGVICYVLLAGYPPFYDEDQKKLFKKIKEGRYYFHEEYWGNTSPEAMDLIKMMLCVDQQKRWSADQLLQHTWITMGDETLQGKSLVESIVTMRKFNARRRLRAAADAVIMANRIQRMRFGLAVEASKVTLFVLSGIVELIS